MSILTLLLLLAPIWILIAWWRKISFGAFLLSLCYFLLRPVFNKRPAVAALGAVLFSGITFGLGHGRTLLENFLVMGLPYSLPLAAVFARRDREHAVGAHDMINMIPTLAGGHGAARSNRSVGRFT